MKTLLFPMAAAVGISMLLTPGQLYAHHAFAAEFDGQKKVTLKGKIVKMDWFNPHAWLYISVKAADGTDQTWALEFGSGTSLIKRGWRKDDLPVGDEVTVDGYLARNGSRTANVARVVMANGKALFATPAPDAPTN